MNSETERVRQIFSHGNNCILFRVQEQDDKNNVNFGIRSYATNTMWLSVSAMVELVNGLIDFQTIMTREKNSIVEVFKKNISVDWNFEGQQLILLGEKINKKIKIRLLEYVCNKEGTYDEVKSFSLDSTVDNYELFGKIARFINKYSDEHACLHV